MNICEQIATSSVKHEDKGITLRDPKASASRYVYQANQAHAYDVISFEKDIFEAEETRCDYGVKNSQNIFYIELKGKDIKTGFVQLTETIRSTKSCFKELNLRARMVATGVSKPAIYRQSVQYKSLIKELKHTSDFVMRTNEFVEKIG